MIFFLVVWTTTEITKNYLLLPVNSSKALMCMYIFIVQERIGLFNVFIFICLFFYNINSIFMHLTSCVMLQKKSILIDVKITASDSSSISSFITSGHGCAQIIEYFLYLLVQ